MACTQGTLLVPTDRERLVSRLGGILPRALPTDAAGIQAVLSHTCWPAYAKQTRLPGARQGHSWVCRVPADRLG